MKALIYMSGGVIQAVTTDNEDFQYKIIDYDNYDTEEQAEAEEFEAYYYEPDDVRPIGNQ